MTTSILGQQFQVGSVPVTIDTPTRVNIKKRRERVVYRALSNRDNINIAYLIGQEITPSNNLFISDRSISLTQNRIPSVENINIVTSSVLTSNVEKFLVTDVFTVESPTRPPVPLFFAHVLRQFNPNIANFSNKTLLSIEFADHTLQPISVVDYVLDTSTGTVFNNIKNTFDNITHDFDVTFVKYTVRTTIGNTQTVEIFHEIIDNQPVYSQASFDDVDELGNIIPGRKKYIIEEQAGGQQFQITLPTSQKYAFKETPESRIKVLGPVALDISAPWNIRVTNGEFLTSLKKTLTSFATFKYRVAEFNNQAFTPFPPYKFQGQQKAIWLNSNLIKVAKGIVVDSAIGLFTEVIVENRAGEPKFAYSNDPEKIGTIYSGSIRYTDGILSTDSTNGFIEVAGPLRSDDIIIVTYYTEETEFEFTTIDFNPVNNQDILSQRIVLYISPESAFTGELTNSLYYLVVNSLGEIIYSSQAAAGGSDAASLKMLSEDFFSDGSPKHQFFYDKESTASGLISRSSGVNLQFIDEFSFIDKYTVESVLLSETTSGVVSGVTVNANFEENPRFLVLADIYVGENQSPESLSKFDIRKQGGGIKDDKRQEALGQQPEVSWFWDFSANKPYPGAGAFLVEIPQDVHKDNGGNFNDEEIADLINRHMKLGGYAIVKKYGINPTILASGCTTTSGTITFHWPSYGPDITYDVNLSTSIDTGFTKQNSSAIADVPSGNQITVTGLNPSTKYFVNLTAYRDNKASTGPTVAFITTTATLNN